MDHFGILLAAIRDTGKNLLHRAVVPEWAKQIHFFTPFFSNFAQAMPTATVDGGRSRGMVSLGHDPDLLKARIVARACGAANAAGQPLETSTNTD
ncbi:MAG: hypothetical protein EPN20_15735 [Magnetospirillum sp.]|nr:MAG: hypothetical protein EPN20_15735 [Magnetospirillum sp.]